MKSHSLIPSLQKYFIPLKSGISVSYITTKSRKSWHDSSRIIHFFVPPGIINSSNSLSTTLCIKKTSVICFWIDAYPLTHPFVTAHGDFNKSNTSLSKVIWPNAIVLRLSCFLLHIYVIPNSSHHIRSCLTQPVKHMYSRLWMLPALTCPQFLL